jgi:hypothetical protein
MKIQYDGRMPASLTKPPSWTVVYATGGRDNAEWHRCQPVAAVEAAWQMRDEIVAAGRPAYSGATHWWDSIGLPEGPAPQWDYVRLQWRK